MSMVLNTVVVVTELFLCISGIGSRALRPLLGIIDPLHVRHMPKNVASYSGFDVLW